LDRVGSPTHHSWFACRTQPRPDERLKRKIPAICDFAIVRDNFDWRKLRDLGKLLVSMFSVP